MHLTVWHHPHRRGLLLGTTHHQHDIEPFISGSARPNCTLTAFGKTMVLANLFPETLPLRWSNFSKCFVNYMVLYRCELGWQLWSTFSLIKYNKRNKHAKYCKIFLLQPVCSLLWLLTAFYATPQKVNLNAQNLTALFGTTGSIKLPQLEHLASQQHRCVCHTFNVVFFPPVLCTQWAFKYFVSVISDIIKGCIFPNVIPLRFKFQNFSCDPPR